MELFQDNAPSDTAGGDDISGVPLPELFEKTSIGHGGAVQPTPMETPLTQEQSTPTENEEKVAKRKNRLQERISRLVSQRNAGNDEAAGLRTQLASMQAEITALRTQGTSLPVTAAAPPVDRRETLSFLGAEDQAVTEQTPPPAVGQQDIAAMIQVGIERALKPIVTQTREAAELAERQRNQHASFDAVTVDYPDLADPDSELRQVFNTIFDGNDDLKKLGNAPEIIAPMARGILADEKRSEQVKTGRKRAASVHVPQPATVDVDPDQKTLPKSMQDAIALAKERVRNGSKDFNDYKLVRLAGQEQYK